MQQRRKRAAWGTILVTGAALVAAGCGGESTDRAVIDADGSSTVFPIMQALAEEYGADHDVDVSVGTSGTGGGFKKFCAGETGISDASRPIKEEEVEACKDGGVEYVELAIATDGLSVVVNPDNDFVDCLTIDQLSMIWKPGSKVSNWSDVDPKFPDLEMSLYGPGTDSGTFDYFTDEVNGEEGASRDDYTASEDDNVLVQGVSGDEGALGYFGYGYVVENKDKVRPIGVDAGDGCVEPTTETIESGEYSPLSRPLFIYVSKDAAGEEATSDFIDFALENVNDLVGDVGFIPLAEDKLKASADSWDAFKGSDAGDAEGEA